MFECAYCPAYIAAQRMSQFLELVQGDMFVLQYRARFMELGQYASHIMENEHLKTEKFIQGLRQELRHHLITNAALT